MVIETKYFESISAP